MSSTGVAASDTIERTLGALAASSVDLQAERWQGLYESFTIGQLEKAVTDTRYHLRFLSAALWAGEQVIYDEYLGWTTQLFANHRLPLEWLTGSIQDTRSVLERLLPPDQADAATAIIDRALGSHAPYTLASRPLVDLDQAFGGLAAYYLSALLGDDPARATRALMDEIDSGASVWDMYLRVIAPAQMELGRLWYLGRLTVGQEHGASAMTERVMAELIAAVRPMPERHRTVITACVGEERHSIGMRMVSDLFSLDGWNVRYVGATTPGTSVVSETLRLHADLVALSMAMSHRIRDTAETVDALRANASTAGVPILVGGHPFALAPRLWIRVGADGCSADGAGAVMMGNQLVADHPRSVLAGD